MEIGSRDYGKYVHEMCNTGNKEEHKQQIHNGFFHVLDILSILSKVCKQY